MAKLPDLKGTGIKLYSQHTSSIKMACFDCRLCFHRWDRNFDSKSPCPVCKKGLLYCGTAFRAPPKRDVKEWAKLEIMIRGGRRFHYFGGNGPIKHLTAAEVKRKVSRRPSRAVDVDARQAIGKAMFVARLPGAGKRIRVKHWRLTRKSRTEAYLSRDETP